MNHHSLVACVALALAVPTVAAAEQRLIVTPAQPTASEPVFVTVLSAFNGSCRHNFVPRVDAAAHRIELDALEIFPPEPCVIEDWTAQFALGYLAPGNWTIDATVGDSLYARRVVTIAPGLTTVTLGDTGYFGTNFRVELEWIHPHTGVRGLAQGVALSDRAAQFWFFAPEIPEVTLKILDGTPINGHHWLFASSMTGVEFTLRIRRCVEGDPPFCEAPVEYHSAAGENLDIVDVEAFD